MELKEKLAELRSRRGLSQQDVAEALDVSRQAVSRWETGAAVPGRDSLLALSRLFGVSVEELVSPAELAVPTGGETRETRGRRGAAGTGGGLPPARGGGPRAESRDRDRRRSPSAARPALRGRMAGRGGRR